MRHRMLTEEDAAACIRAGEIMMIAGPAAALAQLPRGRWIGGTSHYFMAAEGGREAGDLLFCSSFPTAVDAVPRFLPAADLHHLAEGAVPGGFTLITLPAFSAAHARHAREGATWPGLFDQPLVGWIAGVHLSRIGQDKPLVFDGATGQAHEDGAALLHCALPPDRLARVDIVNIFDASDDPALCFRFSEAGFSARKAMVGDAEVDLAAWIADHNVDIRLPLVADYGGASVNVSFQSVDDAKGEVKFYAPVFPGVEYRVARPLADYPAAFVQRAGLPRNGEDWSCNCILNYLYGGLEGQQTPGLTGPVTFGEVAYMLLNQTLVTLRFD